MDIKLSNFGVDQDHSLIYRPQAIPRIHLVHFVKMGIFDFLHWCNNLLGRKVSMRNSKPSHALGFKGY